MYEFAPVLGTALDRGIRPVLRFLHVRLGLAPDHVTWSSFWASLASGIAYATGHVVPAMALMAVEERLDSLVGGLVRASGHVSDGRLLRYITIIRGRANA